MDQISIVALIIFFILMMIYVNVKKYADDSEGNGFMSAFITLGFFCLAGIFREKITLNIIETVKNNIGACLIFTGVYLLTGLVWSFYKWYLFINTKFKSQVERLRINKDAFVDSRPHPERHKALLAKWIAYWPFSFIWFVISNPALNMVFYLRDKFSGVYDGITTSLWDESKLKKDDKERTL